jgi:large subunit ribosomal protein L25
MEVGKLTVQHRNAFGKGPSRRIRTQGLVPGICYGFELDEPLPIVVDPKALHASLDPVKHTNTVIEVTVERHSGPASFITAMLRDYQLDPIRREVTHVDLIAIDTNKTVEVEVPLSLTGKAKGVVLGGTLHLVRRALPVVCRPRDIPTGFPIDVSNMNIGDVLHVSDLKLPEGIKPAVPDRLTIVTLTAPAAEEPTPAEAEAAAAAPAAGDKQAEKDKQPEKKADDKK